MAKKNKPSVDTSVDTLIFDGNNWVSSVESTFDFDQFTFDGLNWIPKEA